MTACRLILTAGLAAIFLLGGCPPEVDVAVTAEDGTVIGVESQSSPPGGRVAVTVELPPGPEGQVFKLEIAVEGEGRVEIIPSREAFEAGSRVILWARPNEGFRFDSWTGSLSGSENPLEVIVDKDLKVGVKFVPLPPPPPPPPPPPGGKAPSVDLKVNDSDGPLELPAGVELVLKWTSQEAATLTASGGWSGAKAASGEEKTGPLAAGIYVFTLTATNDFGSAADSVLVNVKPPPGGQQQVLKIEKLKPAGATVTFKVGQQMEFRIRLTGGVGPFRHRMRFPDFPENPVFNLDSADREVSAVHAFKNPVRPGPLDGFEDLVWNVTDLGTGAEVRTSFYIKVVP